MSIVVVSKNRENLGAARPKDLTATSPLFAELLDRNHDAWRIMRRADTWFLHREVGGSGSHLPHGSIVLSQGPHSDISFNFYHSRGRHSLLETYRPEVCKAIDILLSRERCIALFNGLAHSSVEHLFHIRLGFDGDKVTERRVKLNNDSEWYKHLVDDGQPCSEKPLGSHSDLKHNAAKVQIAPGILVSQKGDDTPSMECCLRYPRPLSLQFSSNRLSSGLQVITTDLSRRVVEHNREVARNF